MMFGKPLPQLIEDQQRHEADYEVAYYAVLAGQVYRAQVEIGIGYAKHGFYLSEERIGP